MPRPPHHRAPPRRVFDQPLSANPVYFGYLRGLIIEHATEESKRNLLPYIMPSRSSVKPLHYSEAGTGASRAQVIDLPSAHLSGRSSRLSCPTIHSSHVVEE